MPYRLLRYSMAIWQAHLRQHPNAAKLPPVIPIVLHHSPTGWRGPTRLSECWALDPEQFADLRPHLPELAFVLDDLTHQTDRALLARAKTDLARLVLLALRNLPDNPRPFQALWRMASILHRLYRSEGGVDAVRALLSYASRVAELDLEQLEDYVGKAIGAEETETIMGITSRQLIEQSKAEGEILGQAKGEALGRAKGEALGRAKGKAELLLRQLGKKFGPLPEPTQQRVRDADPAKLDAWADQVIDAQSLDEALR